MVKRITELNRRKEWILSELQAIDVELDELSAPNPSTCLMCATVRVDGEDDRVDEYRPDIRMVRFHEEV